MIRRAGSMMIGDCALLHSISSTPFRRQSGRLEHQRTVYGLRRPGHTLWRLKTDRLIARSLERGSRSDCSTSRWVCESDRLQRMLGFVREPPGTTAKSRSGRLREESERGDLDRVWWGEAVRAEWPLGLATARAPSRNEVGGFCRPSDSFADSSLL